MDFCKIKYERKKQVCGEASSPTSIKRKIKEMELNSTTIINYKERKVCKTLLHHYGEDYELIAIQMSRTFQPKTYTPFTCRSMLFKQGPSYVTNRTPLIAREINFIHKSLKKYIKSGSKMICINNFIVLGQDIALNFPHRDVSYLKQQYYLLLMQIGRTLCFLYFTERKFKLYCTTFVYHKMTRRTWLLILSLSQIELAQVYHENQVIIKIWESCKSLENYISTFIQAEQYSISEDTNFPQLKGIEKLPFIDSNKIMDIIEPILTCDTLMRICSSNAPYEFRGQHILKRFDNEQKVDYLIADYIIPKKEIYDENGRLDVNHMEDTRDDYKRYFLHITEMQIELIINSDVMSFLLPISTRADQRVGKQPKSFRND